MQKPSDPSRKPWDWPSAILVFLMVQVAAARLVITGWTSYLYFTQTLGAFSVALGLALGYSRFRTRTVRWLAWLYSLVILPWQMLPAVDAQAPYAERLGIVGGRLLFSAGLFLSRKPVEDPLFFVALVSLGFWIIGLTAGYALARNNNTLAVLVPAGVATLIVQLYDSVVPVRIWSLGIYIFLALVYVGRIYLRENRLAWEEKRVFVTSEGTQNLARSLMLVAAVTVFLAWTLPVSISSMKKAAEGWERLARPIRERLNNAVSSLDSPYSSGSGQGDFYDDNLALGINAAVGDTPVFRVTVNTALKDAPPRYYWRGRVYDIYRAGRWYSSDTLSRAFDPQTDEITLPLSKAAREEARFTFTLDLARQTLIYTPSNPIWVNRPGLFFLTPTPGLGADLSVWQADPPFSGGDKYMVRALIGSPTIEDLQAAGTEYPAWVKNSYLRRPDDLPDPILNEFAPLALQVTQGLETPYDKAQAITAYLRENIQYSTNLTAPPKGVDPVLWVLNDYKQGFCMYYASAEVLMLRSIGIPARMVVGFAQGRKDPVTGAFNVLRQDAHAWPEVYFPGTGWVEFEPTANQDPLVRPNRPIEAPTPLAGSGVDGGLLGGQDPLDRESRLNDEGVAQLPPEPQGVNIGWLAGLGLVLAGLLLALNQRFGLAERLPAWISDSYARGGNPSPRWVQRWERWTHLNSIERSFHSINYSLASLGKPQPMHITPRERAGVLRDLLPAAAPLIDTLLHEHQASLYTSTPGNPALARRAAWKLLAHAFKARLLEVWERFDRRFDRTG